MAQVFDQRYEILEAIGKGGMADVYRAHDKVLDRMVAAKILHPQFESDAEFIERFRREAQGAAQLSHPNIVGIYDVGQDAGRHYIIMELVEGCTLKEAIQQAGHLSADIALNVAKEIASALQEAHRHGLVHCDIKPHNILLTKGGHAKVADFGIARAVSSSTMTYTGKTMGSVHYFSPEQARGTTVTPKSDIYSLGIVLYEMLTGSVPFDGETPVSIALKHLQEEPPALRIKNPEVPAAVEALLMKMMMKNPTMRPDSTEVLREIEQAQRQMGAHPVMPPSPDPYATQVLPRTVVNEDAQMTAQGGNVAEEVDEPVFKSKKFIFGLLLVLILGFFAGAFISFGKFWQTAEIAVPDVVGKQMALARQLLEDQKLRVSIAEVYDATVPAGQVVSQSPEANAKVKEERMITIYVSKGGEEMDMPDLTSFSQKEAEAQIKKIGLALGNISEKYSEDEDTGNVISQNPRAGTRINKGQTVNLVVSKGRKARKLSVPDVAGASLDSARSALAARGFNVGNVTRQESTKAQGTVISQAPSANSEAEEGAYIDLVLAEPEKKAQVNKTEKISSERQANDTGADSSNSGPSLSGDTGKTR